jgi:hypothetical protein
LLTTALYWAMLLGAMGLAWYVGGVRVVSDVRMGENFISD